MTHLPARARSDRLVAPPSTRRFALEPKSYRNCRPRSRSEGESLPGTVEPPGVEHSQLFEKVSTRTRPLPTNWQFTEKDGLILEQMFRPRISAPRSPSDSDSKESRVE